MRGTDKPRMDTPLRIGVVGAGVFGGYHAAKCAAHPRVALAGVYDRHPERAGALADREGVAAFAGLETLIAASDAVIVACSATGHAEAGLAALEAGRHVLVEKPIAHEITLAERMVATAERAGVVLQVGHQERFVASAIGLDHIDEVPTAIRCWRHGPYSERGTDVSVALDLMTHDIDLVLWLMGEDPVSVDGEAEAVKSATADMAQATLSFAGTTAWLSASRLSASPERRMEIDYPSGRVDIDFNAKTLVNSSRHPLVANFGDDPKAADSLGAATDAFVAAILDGAPVAITGGMGLRALKIAIKATGGRIR